MHLKKKTEILRHLAICYTHTQICSALYQFPNLVSQDSNQKLWSYFQHFEKEIHGKSVLHKQYN